MATMSNVSKAAIAGFAAGALVSTFAGFVFGGWLTTSKADSIAQSKVSDAVIAVLAPICADRFNGSSDRQAKLILVTRGAQAVANTAGSVQVAQSPVIGLGRVIGSEYARLPCRLVDLNPLASDQDVSGAQGLLIW